MDGEDVSENRTTALSNQDSSSDEILYWVTIGAPTAGGLLILVVILCMCILCCICCSCCACCPCNRKRTVQFNNRGVLAQNADSSLVFAGPGLRSQGTAMWNAADGTAFDATTANLKGGRTLRGPGGATMRIGWESSTSLQAQNSPAVPPRDSCYYILPNGSVNDGSVPTSSWSRFKRAGLMNAHPERRRSKITVGSHQEEQSRAELSSKPWFLGNIDRSEAENLLLSHNVHGCFLIRNTTSDSGDVCLSLLAPEQKFRHLLVVKNDFDMYKISSLPEDCETFNSLLDLVEFYSENEIHFHDSGSSVLLTEPCRVKPMALL